MTWLVSSIQKLAGVNEVLQLGLVCSGHLNPVCLDQTQAPSHFDVSLPL